MTGGDQLSILVRRMIERQDTYREEVAALTALLAKYESVFERVTGMPIMIFEHEREFVIPSSDFYAGVR